MAGRSHAQQAHDDQSGAEVLNDRAGGRPPAGSPAPVPSAASSCSAPGSPARRTTKHRHDTYAIGADRLGRPGVRLSRSGAGQPPGPGGRAPPRRGPRRTRRHAGRLRLPDRLRRAVAHRRGRAGDLREAASPALRARAGGDERPAGAGRRGGAFGPPLEPLAADTLIVDLAEGLLAAERPWRGPGRPRRIDVPAIDRARQFLDAERTRVVHSTELEAITGLTRYELARQFRLGSERALTAICSVRRLDLARQRIRGEPAAGRRGLRGRIRRSGALHAHVQGRVRADARRYRALEGTPAAPLTAPHGADSTFARPSRFTIRSRSKAAAADADVGVGEDRRRAWPEGRRSMSRRVARPP